ncbi:hypothetical protein TCAL_08143 [Tigriopus californicus]|uniref:Myosin tail domain-containing protein n=1 Tax=Tigriopus californicus TaxID=6832 RepID=A0A553P433_TIGCA|nr:coiled-coil domain-containing protein 102A-like [Tigriopus californicus]TRY72433.1 hypothetical protein TCAL_08143 [Tigriopus californicus]
MLAKLRRSVSSASSSSEAQGLGPQPPPALPKRNPELGFGRRKAPPPPPIMDKSSKSRIDLVRSNSMDRGYFTQKDLMSMSLMKEDIDFEEPNESSYLSASTNDVFGISCSGRHSHVLSPTKETLMEHNLNHLRIGGDPSNQKREVDELRARCAQMEKTMRWWSDCTANWRDKWSKVRSERNRYKDELKRVQSKMESQAHEINKLKHERDQARANLELSSNEPSSPQGSNTSFRIFKKPSYVGNRDQGCQTETARGSEVSKTEAQSQTEGPNPGPCSIDDMDFDLTVTSANYMVNGPKKPIPGMRGPEVEVLSPASVDSGVPQSLESQSEKTFQDEDCNQISRFLNDAMTLAGSEHATMLKFRLDEALKTVDAERRDKSELLSEIESLHSQVTAVESQCDELRIARQETSRDLLLARNQGQEQIRSLQLQLEDQLAKKNNLDQIIGHLREELERLQSENAEEWGRRERLQTEKQNVERENRKLRMQIDELRERNRRLTAQTNEHTSGELNRLQAQVQSSSHELVELRHAHNRIRKALAEKSEELVHWQRKSDSFEKEVKKLRQRIEELKKELGRAEDELDSEANTIRRLQRSNEELLGQAEGYQVQIEHLTSRLRALPQNQILPFRRPSRLFPNHLPDPMINAEVESTFSSSEESLPIFDEDEDDDLDLDPVDEALVSHEIETDV